MDFDEYHIQTLFGHEAAESEDPERLRAYYFKSKVYKQIVNDLPLRIVVGHKGIGKSALFQVAIDEETKEKKLTILIKPNDVHGIGKDTTDFLGLINEWKVGINEIIAKKALQSFGLLEEDWRGRLKQFGGAALSYLESTLKVADHADLTATKEGILKNFAATNRIYVYIDDLDRGWEGKEWDIKRISALLNAIRDISTENRGICFRVSLRSDVYFLSRTSDESTDKTEGSVIWYHWTNHEILALLVKRIESYFGRDVNENVLLNKDQSSLMSYLSPIMEERFSGAGHWQNAPMHRVLMSLIRKRPRDLVKLLTLAAREANRDESELIRTIHLKRSFENYSQGRLQDTFNEYRSELPDIERLVMGMKPTKLERRASAGYVYSTDALIKKIKSIEEQGLFRWSRGTVAETRELATFLYKINFLTARKKTNNGIDRKYFEENRYLSNKFVEFGYDWEVHPAYRWALQPDDPLQIFHNLELSES